MISVAEAKDNLRATLMSGKGAICPVCEQHAKIYRRSVNSAQAASLIQFQRSVPEAWSSKIRDAGVTSKHLAMLRYWNLLEEDSRHPNFWRITELGAAFVANRATIPKFALVYDAKCLYLEGEQVSIQDCLGDKFDYEELMGQRFDVDPEATPLGEETSSDSTN